MKTFATTLAGAAIVLVAFLGFTTTASAQKGGSASSGTQKLGVVDTRKIIEQLPEFKEAGEKINEVGGKFKDTLDIIQKDYIAALEAYDKQKAMMSADAKTKQEENIRSIQERYVKYRQDKLDPNNPKSEIAQLQEELTIPLRKRVRTAIESVAKDEKLSAVLESPAFIYFDEQMDITFRVLDKLKRNK
jgi:outer membrane protein